MEFTLKTTLNASPREVYSAWLDSAKHSKMTGGAAEISDKVGSRFAAWDGYIEGNNLAIEPYRRILQSWRTSEFEDDDPDSQIEVLLEDANGQTELTLIHTNLSESGERYKQGWVDFYFEPMKAYFK